MKRKQFSEEQIIGILKEAEAGAVVTELCRKHGLSSATYYAWKAKFGGLEVSDATWLGRSPHTATPEDLRRFQIEQQEAGVPVPTMNNIVAALRFFFTRTLDRPELARKLVRTAHARKISVMLTMAEVKRLLDATTCLKHQAALSVAQGAGSCLRSCSAQGQRH